jgi:hypothetical protein
MITNGKLARYAKWAAKLLLTEMFVPGGTLVVLAVLLAGRSAHLIARSRMDVPFRQEDGRPALGPDLIADPAIQRLE